MKNINSRKGITLIELLACVAIIAILAALLLPAISKVRLKADEAAFVSNLRSVSVAVLLLTAENNNTIPAYIDARAGAQTMWQLRVAPYLGEDPSAPQFNSPASIYRSALRDPGDKTLWRGQRPTRNIGINGYANFTTVAPSGATNRPLLGIKHPSKLALLGPGVEAAVNTEWGGGASIFVPILQSQGLKPYSRYGQFMHFAFVDGHIEKLTWDRVNQELQLANRSQSMLFDTAGYF